MKQINYEAGHKAAKLLAWSLRKQPENTFFKIRHPVTNKTTSNLDGIQKVFEIYYKSLYSQSDKADRHTIVKFLNSFDFPSLGTEQNDFTNNAGLRR